MPIDELTDVQKQALEHIRASFLNNINPICALDMGLGKTRVACEIIGEIVAEEPDNFKVLIVHKASNYMDPWIKELEYYRFIKPKNSDKTGYTNHVYIHGNERKEYLRYGKYHFKARNILLTSYETLRQDIENDYYDLNNTFDLIIFDELHTIMNYRDFTQKSIAIITIQAKRKLALTGTPIQNSNKELGLLYVFLNNQPLFLRLISIRENEAGEKDDKINSQIDKMLNKALDECIENNAVFHFDSNKEGFIKNTRILSLPIDKEMYDFSKDYFKPLEPKQQMYLSHPASVLKNADKNILPRCTKSDAVTFILQSTLKDEKIIIFSLYIDVLNVYFNICENLGFSAIKITGQDKGKKIKEKMTYFRYSSDVKVLLTTLQKSSEGYNFDMATHVIILEFWWNPQKLFQAMSRIDRITQNRNIFIYLLCYNHNGEIIAVEDKYYTVLTNKAVDTINTYKKIESKHAGKKYLFQNKEMPEMKVFNDISTLNIEFPQYLSQFQHTPRDAVQVFDSNGAPLSAIREIMATQVNNYLQCIEMLSIAPWRIRYSSIVGFIKTHIRRKINSSIGKELIETIDKKNAIFPFKITFESYYPFIFIKTAKFNVMINSINVPFSIKYVLGKQKCGIFDILEINTGAAIDSKSLYNRLYLSGISEISTVILADQAPSMIKSTQDIIKQYYPDAKCQICMTSLYKKVVSSELSSSELNNIEYIFSQSNVTNARKLSERLFDERMGNFYIYKRIKNYLTLISHFYHYPPELRSVIGTTNLIEYIAINVQILLEYQNFQSKEFAWRYIDIASRRILEAGKNFIPAWDTITKPINPQ